MEWGARGWSSCLRRKRDYVVAPEYIGGPTNLSTGIRGPLGCNSRKMLLECFFATKTLTRESTAKAKGGAGSRKQKKRLRSSHAGYFFFNYKSMHKSESTALRVWCTSPPSSAPSPNVNFFLFCLLSAFRHKQHPRPSSSSSSSSPNVIHEGDICDVVRAAVEHDGQ
jgi:hypothetical protein